MKTGILTLIIVFTRLVSSAQRDSLAGYKVSRNGFYENKGQIVDQNYKPNASVKYLLCTPDFNVQLRTTGFSYDTYTDIRDTATDRKNKALFPAHGKFKRPPAFTRHFHRVDIELLGSNLNTELLAEGESKEYYNYFTAGTLEGGVSYVHYFQKVTYKNIYPNIDLDFFVPPSVSSGKTLPVEYNFIVHSGGNINDIKMQYKGANNVMLKNNQLVVNVNAGDFSENIPNSYWSDSKKSVQVNYLSLNNNTFGFATSNIPPSGGEGAALIIDPTPNLAWGTYYGGSGDDYGTGIAIDAGNDVYITGYTGSSNSIATVGTHQIIFAGGFFDAFVAKFNPTGTSLTWGTYYGGAQFDEGFGIALNASNDVYITGATTSTSGIATPGAYQVTNVYQDAFVAEFNSSGSTLLWGTYYGGPNGTETSGVAIALDASDNVYVTGLSSSPSGIATVGAYQTIFGGGNPWFGDAFVAKFNPTGTALLWGTYYGGTNDEILYGMTLDASNNVYITGGTASSNAISTLGAYQVNFGTGTGNTFVAKFNSSGSTLLWGTYYGGNGNWTDNGYGIALGTNDTVYITGGTASTSGIASPGALETVFSGSTIAYVAKLAPNGSSRIWGTYFCAGDQESDGSYIALDACGNVYMAGDTFLSGLFPTGIATAGAYETNNTTGSEVGYIAKINTSGNLLLYGTYYGGAGLSSIPTDVLAMTMNTFGNIYITGYTTSTLDIAMPGAYQFAFGGGSHDALVAEFDNNPLCINPLPIQLSAFDVICANNSAAITWTTATETNNKYFTVERSTDGINFDEVAKVNGAGNSSTALNYSATDYTPLPGTSYYRLSQTDYDGHTETFPPVAFSGCVLNGTTINAFTNSEGNIVVHINSISPGNYNIALINMVGQQLLNQTKTLLAGYSEFMLTPSRMANGLYLLRISNESVSYSAKIIESYHNL